MAMAKKMRKNTKAMAADHKEQEDKISELPDHLLQHILSFLPSIELVFQITLLSKRWKTLWPIIPVLKFPSLMHLGTYLNTQNSVANSHSNSSIIAILNIRTHNAGYNSYHVEGFLNYFLETNTVNVLDISTIYNNWILTKSALSNVASSSSLTLFRLKGIYLKLCEPNFPNNIIIFPFLKTLSLNKVYISTNGSNFPIGFPSLTTLSLIDMDLRVVLFQNIISNCPILESLRLCSTMWLYGDILYIRVCRQLKSLYLDFMKLNDQLLEYVVSQIPLLEKLYLRNCYGLKRFNIHSQTLKSLCCIFSHGNVLANISAPNLVYFRFGGEVGSIVCMNSLNLLEANVKVADVFGKFQNYDQSWYFNLLMLLSNLKCSDTLKLEAPSRKALLFPENMRQLSPPLPDLRHLKVKMHKEDKEPGEAMLRDALHWCAPFIETLEINYN